jgi:DNA-binding winged helix-turn-helix (wHTH) protein
MRAPALEGFAGSLLYPRDCPDYSPRPISGPDSGAAVRFFFGEFALDIGRRELRRGAALIAMEPQVFDLLIYLVQNRERVVSKDDLIASVWHGRIVSESTLSSRIAAVRKTVGDSGKEQNLIRTAARKGIRFVGTVTEVPDDSICHCAARAFLAASRTCPISPAFSRRPIW